MIIGCILVVTLTWFAPPETVGLAYDSGGVTTNIVTVPLIAALGIGLAGAAMQSATSLCQGAPRPGGATSSPRTAGS